MDQQGPEKDQQGPVESENNTITLPPKILKRVGKNNKLRRIRYLSSEKNMAKTMQQIIADALNEQNALLAGPHASDWKRVLIKNGTGYVPPIVWFGNAASAKNKVITIGVNPSRKEFCDKHGNLLEKSRIVLSNNAKDLEQSFNDYFNVNPYANWFGRDGKIEGFLNGMRASYYDGKADYQAIHIDLFPFATNPTFTRINGDFVQKDLFSSKWTKEFVMNLIEAIEPRVIIVFGSTNIKYFQEAVAKAEHASQYLWTDKSLKSQYTIGKISTGHTVVLLNTYLGNPRSFGTSDLNNLGQDVLQHLGLH